MGLIEVKTAKITEKGQISIPKDMRNIEGFKKGSKIAVLAFSDHVELRPINSIKNGSHALWYAVRHSHVVFIRKLYAHAKSKNWNLWAASYNPNELPFSLAVEDRFFCTQTLALRDGAPFTEIYFIAGKACNRNLNQCLLTLFALTQDPAKRKLGISEALMGVMQLGYSTHFHYRRASPPLSYSIL